jgi:two-component system, OmpR family, alkaline phosphatase synthesis response regulator PhoP
MATILIIEDEKAINDLIAMNLKMVGHNCIQLYDGKNIIEEFNKNSIDLAILDIMLPGEDGFSLIPEFLAKEIPVIFLTAKSSLSDKVHGLEIGAEDYIVKPFEAVELIARVNVVLRRGKKSIDEFRIDETIVNFNERKITVEGKEVDITNKEFELIEILILNKNIALSREKILELIWGYDFFGETRTVDVHIQKLRKKLKWENHIKTIFRYGYRLEA